MRLAIVLFLLFYSNSLIVFGLPLAYIYKALLLFLLLYVNNQQKIDRMSFLFSVGLILSMFLNGDTFNFPFKSIVAILNWLIFFLCVNALRRRSLRIPLMRSTPYLAVLFTLPFFVGLPSLVDQDRGLEQFGGSGYRLLGPFENSHTFGFALSIILIIHLFLILHRGIDYKNLFTLAVCSIGIYSSYTRTIWIGLILGIFVVLKANNIRMKRMIFPSLILFGLLFYAWSSDAVFKSRVLDTRIEKSQDDVIMEMGSGRGRLWYGTCMNFVEGPVKNMIFGYGVETSQKNLELRIGQRLKPHNGILQILIEYGVLGLIMIYLKFKLFSASGGIGKQPAWIMFFTFFMFQGTVNYVIALFFALMINLNVKDI
jgi:O-antigen ligase